MITLCNINNYDIDTAHALYVESFPAEERRPWDDIIFRSSQNQQRFRLLGIYIESVFTGFITIWKFPSFRYVEHFAIYPSMRSRGIGAEALAELISYDSSPIVLEVELPKTSLLALRRIGFYSRCGFTPHPEYQYIQPPYAADLPPVPLMLMTYGVLNLDNVTRTLHRHVYGISD